MTPFGDLFGRMIATLERPVPSEERRFLSKRNREPHSYFGFFASTAIEWLAAREGISNDEAMNLLNQFIGALLLHLPNDRMCSRLKNDGAELQPTAKGFAYLEEWFKANSNEVSETQCEKIIEALSSPYNSMELIRLERGLLSGNLLLSTGFAMWLWLKMLGERPSIFDGTIRKEDKLTMPKDTLSIFNVNAVDMTTLPVVPRSEKKAVKSPYWTSSMMHPSTSSIMQYWDARGVRFFESLQFERPLKSKFAGSQEYTLSMCLSGKAMWQWVMECTTAEKPAEAAKIVRIFVDQRFVEPITDRLLSWATCNDHLPVHVSRQTFYRFTQRGVRLCVWEDMIDFNAVKPSSADGDEENAIRWMMSHGPSASDFADSRTWAWMFINSADRDGLDNVFKDLVTLDLINQEPGLKVPFRIKLEEWLCGENLRYIDNSQRVLLLLNALHSAKNTVTRKKLLQAQVYQEALELKRLFIQVGAPFQLNISQALRDRFLRLFTVEEGMVAEALKVPIGEIQTECMLLLKGQITRFVQEDDLRHLPLSAYVVGRYKNNRSGPSLKCLRA